MTTQIVSTAGSGLVFDNTYTASCSQQYINCIVAAEQTLEKLWTNPVTINVTFAEAALGANGTLAENTFYLTTVPYSAFAAALPASDLIPSTDPTGGHTWEIPTAYARMLGLPSYSTSTDDTVTLNSSYNWSFGQDVINTVEHELSEGAMGRIGGLGDQSGSVNQNGYWSTMDLFRYSSPGQRDFSDGRDGKTTYFSANGSVLSSLSFNNDYSFTTQRNSGDTADFAQQDVFGTGSVGETNSLSQTDIAIMDALGWKPATQTHVNPAVTAQNFSVSPNQAISVASDLSVSNPSGDSLTTYWIEDLGGGTGHLAVGGVAESNNTWIQATSNWANVQYVGGSSLGSDNLEVRVFDATTNSFVYSQPFTATTKSLPDLRVGFVGLHSGAGPGRTVQRGTNVTFEYSIQNIGTASAGGSFEAWQLDALPTATSFLGENSLGSLAAGSTATFTDTISTANLSLGTHTLYVTADNGNLVQESNETNNTLALTFTVTAPITWKAGVTGNFAVGSNWTTGQVPGQYNDVLITAPASQFYFALSSSAETVNSVSTGASAGLAVTGGTFVALNGTGSGSNAGEIYAGTGGIFQSNNAINSTSTGMLYAHGGVMNLGIVNGGSAFIDAGGKIVLRSASNSTNVDFLGAGTLDLSHPSTFAGTVQNLGIGDYIDLPNISAAHASLSYNHATNILTVKDTVSGTTDTIRIAGTPLGIFTNAGSDGSSGVLITDPPTSATTQNNNICQLVQAMASFGVNTSAAPLTTNDPLNDTGQSLLAPNTHHHA